MTTLLQQAFDEASKLPEREQDAIAFLVLEELASERKWDDVFANSQDVLERLAEETLQDIAAGRTRPLDPADL